MTISKATNHPYDNNTSLHNIIFHPLHFKQTKITLLSVITNLFLTLITGSLWLIPYLIVNRLENRNLKIWKNENARKANDAMQASLRQDNVETKEPPKLKEPNPQPNGPKLRARDVLPSLSHLSKVEIPKQVSKSLDIIFNIENVVSKIPIFNENNKHLPVIHPPVIQDVHTNGPYISIKVVAADPEDYYEKNVKAKMEANLIEDKWIEAKEQEIELIKTNFFFVTIGKKYKDGSDLQWEEYQSYYPDREPVFFSLASDDLTYEDTGNVTENTKSKLKGFQDLFHQGEGIDLNGNKWKIVDYDKVKIHLFS